MGKVQNAIYPQKQWGNAATTLSTEKNCTDSQGNVFVCGSINANYSGISVTKIGTQDALVMKIGPGGELRWAKNFGGSGVTATAIFVGTDSAGFVYVCGQYSGGNLSTPSLTKLGTTDIFLIKLDSATGAVQWQRSYGGSAANCYPRGLTTDATSIYIGGYWNTAALSNPSTGSLIGSSDGLVLKIATDGTTTWFARAGGAAVGTQHGPIAVDPSGNVWVSGTRNGNWSTPSVTGGSNTRATLTKYNSSGTYQASYAFVNASGTWVVGIMADATYIYMAGAMQNNATTPSMTKIGTTDGWVLRITAADGTVSWNYNFGGSGASVSPGFIGIDPVGAVYVAGEFSGANLSTPAATKVGTADGYLIKLTSAGAFSWRKTFGGSGATCNNFPGLSVDKRGFVYLTGAFSGANLSAPAATKVGTQDFLTWKYNPAGT